MLELAAVILLVACTAYLERFEVRNVDAPTIYVRVPSLMDPGFLPREISKVFYIHRRVPGSLQVYWRVAGDTVEHSTVVRIPPRQRKHDGLTLSFYSAGRWQAVWKPY